MGLLWCETVAPFLGHSVYPDLALQRQDSHALLACVHACTVAAHTPNARGVVPCTHREGQAAWVVRAAFLPCQMLITARSEPWPKNSWLRPCRLYDLTILCVQAAESPAGC